MREPAAPRTYFLLARDANVRASSKFKPVGVRARAHDVAHGALRGLRRQQFRLVHLSGARQAAPSASPAAVFPRHLFS